MTEQTNATILAAIGRDAFNLEFPELTVPVLGGMQRQGDVLIHPANPREGGVPLGKGIEVVRSEAGGNTHMLHGDGTWLASPQAATNLTQGWLTVPEGGEAWLTHSGEHNAAGIAPGSYEIRRQREWAGEWRRVAD